MRGGISYEYQTGPDGRRYAVGGEVSIDTAPESTPEDTIRKAQTIRQAALAPAEPSGQDRRAAAAAAQMEMKARQEMSQAKLEGEETGEEVLGASEEAGDEVLHNGTSQGVDKTAHDMPEGGLTKAEGVAVSEVQKQDGGGLSDVAQTKKKDGLPHTPAPTGAPVMQLDYGQNHRASGLVDMYG